MNRKERRAAKATQEKVVVGPDDPRWEEVVKGMIADAAATP